MEDLLVNKKHPYICTPLTGKTKEIILNQLDTVVTQEPDIIEWRADFLSSLSETDEVIEIIDGIKSKTKIPLLFTIRAEHEGGEKISLTEKEKVQLIRAVCERTSVDMIDYETSNETNYVKTLKSIAEASNKKLILSYHNFSETPNKAEIIERAKQAESLGADIAKFAVMPNSKEDVFQLLDATREIDALLNIPVVTMSMGDIGGFSRIVGWAYGSIITFGVGVELSAPGQIPVKQLREAIQRTQQLIPKW
ncbi:type I 3-dehydroquinate dehydratase [Virgibacillus sp. W0430]|uniref:type I 3-dehydroquinate dehydratase n=1 Tax=Virgibacillus sp. W0430 TaxID=3391580 RepID=UPI003F47FB2D